MDSTPDNTAKQRLATSLDQVPEIGAKLAGPFARLGLHTVRDLLFCFPRDYLDLTNERTLDTLEEGRPVAFRGVVEEIDLRNLGPRRSVLGVLVRQEAGCLQAIWFNQPYLRDRFAPGQHILLFGKASLRANRWQMSHPRFEQLENQSDQPESPLLPVYRLTEGVSQYHLRRAAKAVLDAYLDMLDEVFSPAHLAEYDLLPLREALPQIHFPHSQDDLEQARHRLIFQELLILQLALGLLRHQQHDLAQAAPLELSAKIDARIRRLLPFELTKGQDQAIREVADDLQAARPMNRLLQGDVGSGKTIVAVYAMMLCVARGFQAVLMAPTEVLARQHYETLGQILAAGRVKVGFLSGSVTGSARETMLQEIAQGEIELVIGTQAIVMSGCEFNQLGLVVIDEQHKFGVRQRSTLKQAGLDPHYLVMTATPIPRSVAMTLFGDLDVSTIRDSPPGRQPINTYLVEPANTARWWDFLKRKLAAGRQAYVVAPLVEESEAYAVENVQQVYRELAAGVLRDWRLGLLHGRMSPAEKQQAMEDFRQRKTHVLVSTSVIEVGVDVPNASVITIMGADRFGLAQLHQLRGRVGRGQHPGFCGVLADPQTAETSKRLQAFVEINDGFELAEIDFELRGPGDLFGTKQHGLPPFRVADLARDDAIHQTARTAAKALIQADPGLALPENQRLRTMVLTRYGKALDLGDVG